MHQLLFTTILLSCTILSKSASINNTNVNKTVTLTTKEINDVNDTAKQINDVNDTPKEIIDVNDTTKQIEILQKEKDELYIKINEAIDEAIPELEKSNDTEASTGIEHLKTLKQQIKEIHETPDSDEGFNASQVNGTESRRKLSKRIDRAGNGQSDWIKKFKKDEFYNRLMKSKDEKYTSMPMVLNRQKIAEQIQQWIAQQRQQKKKHKEMKVKHKIDFERCPDFGRGKEKKHNKEKKAKINYFPCCRKCCKKSYLGCL